MGVVAPIGIIIWDPITSNFNVPKVARNSWILQIMMGIIMGGHLLRIVPKPQRFVVSTPNSSCKMITHVPTLQHLMTFKWNAVGYANHQVRSIRRETNVIFAASIV